MSTRYVWDKYNATEQYTWYDRPAYDLIQTGGGYEVSITINGTTLKNPPWGSADATVTVPAGTFQYDVRGSWGYQPGKVRTTTTTTFRWFYRQYDDYWLIVDQAISIGNPTGYEQGSFIGSVSSSDQSAYPYGYYNGYWYTSKGSDNIDPKSISYPSNIKTGQSITLTTTKSSGIKYGGTIIYTYEVQLNGGSWTSIGDSTSLTKSYTVPAGTTTFRARVKAKDNMGFASTTYATGNQVTVINNSAPTISGSDKDLGSFSYQPPYIHLQAFAALFVCDRM